MTAEARLAAITGILGGVSSRRDWQGRAVYLAYQIAADDNPEYIREAWAMLEEANPKQAHRIRQSIERVRKEAQRTGCRTCLGYGATEGCPECGTYREVVR